MIAEWAATFLQHPKKCVPTHEATKTKNTYVDEENIQLFFRSCLRLMKKSCTVETTQVIGSMHIGTRGRPHTGAKASLRT